MVQTITICVIRVYAVMLSLSFQEITCVLSQGDQSSEVGISLNSAMILSLSC